PPRPRIENLDQLPFPAFDKIDINRYKFIYTITSRGCPYRCSFCYRTFFWGNKMAFRSMDNVIEEIKFLYEKCDKKKFSEIQINDDTFILNKKRVFEFCDKLKKEKIDINWSCNGRINLMNEQLMKKMSESGCDSILYGIESGSDKILKKINKDFSAKMAREVIMKSKKYFPKIRTSFIWGFPFETIEDFKKTIELTEKVIFEWRIHANLLILTPQIGTQIYNEYKNHVIPWSPSIPKMILHGVYGPLKTLHIMCERDNIFEAFKNEPKILLFYYRYKTPNFPQKLKIYERLIKKYNFYTDIVLI
ncbi:MAG: radical SAM protein, partial [Candidatus Aenigmarchaeota archaeon]|nr:radical SAM protein [Candidatus Aenigmarchaeota archaeon]